MKHNQSKNTQEGMLTWIMNTVRKHKFQSKDAGNEPDNIVMRPETENGENNNNDQGV